MKFYRWLLALVVGVVIGALAAIAFTGTPTPQANPDLSQFQGMWYGAKPRNENLPPGFRALTKDDLKDIEKGINPAKQKYAAEDFITLFPEESLHIGPRSISIFDGEGNCSTWMCQKQDTGNGWSAFEMKHGSRIITGRLELISDGLLRFNEAYYLSKHVSVFDK